MYAELSHACSFPLWPLGLIAVSLKPRSDGVPHDLTLGDLLGLAGSLQIAGHRRVQVEAVQELAWHLQYCIDIYIICQAHPGRSTRPRAPSPSSLNPYIFYLIQLP